MILGIERVVIGSDSGGGVLFVALHFGLGLGLSDAGLQLGEQAEEVAAAAARLGGVDLEGGPKLRRIGLPRGKGEILGHDADDDTGIAVEPDISADDGGVAAVRALPEGVREHGGVGGIGLVVLGGEEAAVGAARRRASGACRR